MPGKSRALLAAEALLAEQANQANGILSPKLVKHYARRAYDLALLGLDDQQIAEHWDVDRSTMDRWKVEHPQIRRNLDKARLDAPARLVRSLHRAGNGYTLKDKRTKKDASGQVVETIEQKRHFPPNVNAAALVLTNRRPDQWRERKSVDVSATISLESIVAGLVQDGSQAKVIDVQPTSDPQDMVSEPAEPASGE